MRSKIALCVLLMAAQAAYAFDSVPMAEYRQRRVKLQRSCTATPR